MAKETYPYIVEVRLLVSGRLDKLFRVAYDKPQEVYQHIFDEALQSWLECPGVGEDIAKMYSGFLEAMETLSPEEISKILQGIDCEIDCPEETETTTIDLPRFYVDMLDRVAKKNGKTASQVLTEIISQKLGAVESEAK